MVYKVSSAEMICQVADVIRREYENYIQNRILIAI